MEKPQLEKVIERLKRADLEMWEVDGEDFDAKYLAWRPRFKITLNGVKFDIRICAKVSDFTRTKYYYFLSIEDWHRKFEVTYDDRKNYAEQKQLKDFYENLLPFLRKREEEKLDKERTEFKKAIDELLSD
jgi:hypothetical protein